MANGFTPAAASRACGIFDWFVASWLTIAILNPNVGVGSTVFLKKFREHVGSSPMARGADRVGAGLSHLKLAKTHH